MGLLPKQVPITKLELEVFKNILKKAKKMVSEWSGYFYFVDLPWLGSIVSGHEHVYRKNVFRTIKELDIPFVDINEMVFQSHPDPLSLYPFRRTNHYNAEGYRLIAEAIGKRLKADGILH